MSRRFHGFTVLALSAVLGASLVTTSSSSAQVASLPQISRDQLLAIANVAAPPAGTGLEIHADFPAEAPLMLDSTPITALTAAITPAGDVVTRSVVTSATATSSGDTVDECTDPAFTPTGEAWSSESAFPIPWKFNASSTPRDISTYQTRRSIRVAHRIWPRAKTTCKAGDAISIRYDFQGTTHKGAKYDGTNVVGFSDLGSGALAVNSTWYSGGKILEVDLEINKADYKWTNRFNAPNLYQIEDVTTHELGHQVGLDDLSDPHGGLTMFGRISKGEVKKLTLGRGDLKGASTLSP